MNPSRPKPSTTRSTWIKRFCWRVSGRRLQTRAQIPWPDLVERFPIEEGICAELVAYLSLAAEDEGSNDRRPHEADIGVDG